jgi:hypothetical protein
MALTKATYSMIKGAPLNVLDFGAVGNGITNDTAAFTAAFVESATSGKPVYMPKGTYLVDEISLTNGIPVGNGNKIGQYFYGDGIGKTILKCSGTKNKFLSLLGVPGLYFYTRFKAEDFSIDMALMPNASTSIGIYAIFAFGGSVNNVDIINPPANAISLYLDQGCYTTVWENCDFEGEIGRVKIQGIGTQSVTTQTFIGCLWGQMIADNCSANSYISCIVQGNLTPKFVLSEQYGLYISGCDFEGTGVLYAFGVNVNQLTSIGNALVGFSGTYLTGTPNASFLLDQIYPLTSTGNPFTIQNQAITSAAVTNGECVALKLNGTVNESVDEVGLTRKNIQNTSGGASAVEIEFSNSNGQTYVGQDAAGNSIIDARGTTKVTLQQNGVDKFGVNAAGALAFNTTTSGSAGVLAGYLNCTVGGVSYKIPYYLV